MAAEYRRRGIPLDVIYLDIDYMKGYRLFTWDADRFPDPAALTKELADQGIRVVAIVDPGVKIDETYAVYQSGSAHDAWIAYANGEPFQSQVWPGLCVFPDFLRSSIREWWGSLNREWVMAYGIGGIWNDMNEPALFGIDPRHPEIGGHATDVGIVHRNGEDNPVPHWGVHNVYALLQAAGTVEGLMADQDTRPFLLSRSGFAGIQHWAAVWTGDNSSWWEHLKMAIPMCINLGLSGIPFVGPDIGGFFGAPSPELFARWIQMGVFFPFARIHSDIGTPDQEPWAFGPDVEAIAKRYIGYRYRLLPYLETLFEEAHRTGTPIMRPLFWEFPDDAAAYTVEDQFLLGPMLLIAPVTEPGSTQRVVYLPETDWYDPWTRRILSPGWHPIESPIDRLPIFIRSGGIVPLGPQVDSTARLRSRWEHGEDGPDEIWIIRGQGALTCYSDDGETFAMARGYWRRIAVTVTPEAADTIITVTGQWPDVVTPPTKHLRLRISPYTTRPTSISLDGQAADGTWIPEHACLEMTLPPLQRNRPVHIVIR
ncbi:glucosyl hydrolase family protein [Sulfobacillus acidophilus TPY]|nr:glucosyl hydrolase family protein [Sulfobacillus acidophilus TPY]